MFDTVHVEVTGGTLSQTEIDAYILRARQQYPDKFLYGIDIELDDEYVNLTYHWTTVPFERIRRISGADAETDEFSLLSRPEEKGRAFVIVRQ